jgi:hypothetical protein
MSKRRASRSNIRCVPDAVVGIRSQLVGPSRPFGIALDKENVMGHTANVHKGGAQNASLHCARRHRSRCRHELESMRSLWPPALVGPPTDASRRSWKRKA